MIENNLLKKLYFKQWVIGIAHEDIGKIIRTKSFSQKITWLEPHSDTHFHADPFIIKADESSMKIIFEDFSMDYNFGNISLLTLNKSLDIVDRKILLDTGSHLSFPFVYRENGKTFIIPESAHSGKVSIYEYDELNMKLEYRGDLLDRPLYDPSILKIKEKYWLMGCIFEDRKLYKLHVFHSEFLFGPYSPLETNPVKQGLDGVRSAGSFINVDGNLYRPTQNCGNKYGESITIYRLNKLDEKEFSEDMYMTIKIDDRNRKIHNIQTIHTLNIYGNTIVVDGIRWELSLKKQVSNFFRNRRLLKQELSK
ncbi:MAG TPA: hypothetical protein VHO50_12075 [Bacteroidales bacterium]|nr:hypothetical protein [Bacteroidales bacterium]